MSRTARIAPGGMVFHVLNRGNHRMPIFEADQDYLAFLRVVRDTLEKKPMRVLAYCLMPNQGNLQVVSRARRRAFSYGLPLCGTQCLAGRLGAVGRAVVLGQPLAKATAFRAGRLSATVRLAVEASAKLDGPGQPGWERGGTGRPADLDPPRPSFRQRVVAASDRRAAGSGVDLPRPRSSEEEEVNSTEYEYWTYPPLFFFAIVVGFAFWVGRVNEWIRESKK